jgi:DNA polymerase-3 subunit beta
VKFTCDQSMLSSVMRNVVKAASSDLTGSTATNAVRITVSAGKATFTATNMDVTIRETVPVRSSADGDVLVPARMLNDFVRSMPAGSMDVAIDGSQLRLSSGSVRMNVSTIPVESAPSPSFPTSVGVEIPAAELLAAVAQVTPAASKETNRPILTGILMEAREEGLRLVATDSYRLAIRDIPGLSAMEAGKSIVAPAASLGLAIGLFSDGDKIKIRLDDQAVSLETDSRCLVLRLLSGSFPNYRALLTSGAGTTVVIEKAAFSEALKRACMAATSAKVQTTKLTVSPDSGTVELDSGATVCESMEADVVGDEVKLAANANYFLQAVGAFDSDSVKITMTEPVKPIRLSDEKGSLLYIVMPTRA